MTWKTLCKYNSEICIITIINADNKFKPPTDKVKDKLDVTTNYTNPGDHVAEIYQNNKTVKERYRAQYYSLLFHNIPKVMIIYLDFEVVRKLNYFPVKGGL